MFNYDNLSPEAQFRVEVLNKGFLNHQSFQTMMEDLKKRLPVRRLDVYSMPNIGATIVLPKQLPSTEIRNAVTEVYKAFIKSVLENCRGRRDLERFVRLAHTVHERLCTGAGNINLLLNIVNYETANITPSDVMPVEGSTEYIVNIMP